MKETLIEFKAVRVEKLLFLISIKKKKEKAQTRLDRHRLLSATVQVEHFGFLCMMWVTGCVLVPAVSAWISVNEPRLGWSRVGECGQVPVCLWLSSGNPHLVSDVAVTRHGRSSAGYTGSGTINRNSLDWSQQAKTDIEMKPGVFGCMSVNKNSERSC